MTHDQELKQESDQDQTLRQEIELIVERLQSECVPRIYPDLIVQEIMGSHPAPEGKDAEFYLLLGREHIRKLVGERLRNGNRKTHTVGRQPEPSDVRATGEAYLQHAEELRQYAEQRKKELPGVEGL